jgi:hypothetical protein
MLLKNLTWATIALGMLIASSSVHATDYADVVIKKSPIVYELLH